MTEVKDDIKREKVRIIPIHLIDDFPEHPFQVKDEMSKIRKDMRICMDIAERHGVVEYVVNTIFTQEQRENENQRRKEKTKE